MVDECDVFVGILRRRWGTSTGDCETGFIEEFERAVERRRSTSREPEVCLFFADLPRGEIDDAGPELSRVLGFRARVESEKTTLYSTYRDHDDLAQQVSGMLHRYLVGRMVDRSSAAEADAGSSGSVSRDAEPASVDDSGTRDGQELSDAAIQIVAMLDSLRAAIGGQGAAGSVDQDRLTLLGIALSPDDETIGSHLTNRLYRRRDELELIVAEHSAWVSAMLADIGSATNSFVRVIPGWGVLDPEDEETASMLARFAASEGTVGRGALRSLLRLGLRPTSLWPATLAIGSDGEGLVPTREELTRAWISILNAHPGSGAAVDALLRDLDRAGDTVLEELGRLLDELAASDQLNDESASIVTAAREAVTGSYDALISALGTPSTTTAPGRLVLQHINELSGPVIDELAGQTTERALRLAAIRAGLTAGTISDERLADLLLLQDDPEITDLLLQSTAEDAEVAVRYAGLMQADATRRLPSATEARLLAQHASREQLDELIATSSLSSLPWEALTYAFPESVLDEARQVLRADPRFIRDAVEAIPGDEQRKVGDFLADARLRAAANLLARQSDPTGEDIDLVFDWIHKAISPVGVVTNAAWSALNHIASKVSVVRLEDELRPHADALVTVRVLRLLDSGDSSTLTQAMASVLLNGEVDLIRAQAKCWFLRCPERSITELRDALYEEDASVRISAAKALTGRLGREDLLELHNEYPKARERYWYNVVVFLDEKLYAPTP